MVEKGNEVAFRRDSRVANPSCGLVERIPYRVLETHSRADDADNGKIGAIGSPVRRQHVLQNLARGASGKRRPGERTAALPAVDEVTAERKGELSRGRNREDVGAWQRESDGFGTAGP